MMCTLAAAGICDRERIANRHGRIDGVSALLHDLNPHSCRQMLRGDSHGLLGGDGLAGGR
jgi:hypothetical protein